MIDLETIFLFFHNFDIKSCCSVFQNNGISSVWQITYINLVDTNIEYLITQYYFPVEVDKR